MTLDILGAGALDYLPCRYGTSKLLFRGPRRSLTDDYVAFLGGTETYGKFIAKPYPTLVEEQLGATCVNFGYPNAGIDAFVHDPFVLDAAAKAQISVIQLMGAANLSNRFYSVHPRRNDRFTNASTLLKTIYREVDFTDFNFNRHMLSALARISPERFEAVRTELQEAWVARMRSMLAKVKGKSILLWFSADAPMLDNDVVDQNWLGPEPLFVTRGMIDKLSDHTTEIVEVTVSDIAITNGTRGMVFDELEHPAAKEMLGPMAHEEAAQAVADALSRLL